MSENNLNSNLWSKERPTKPGWYWCIQSHYIRMVNVWESHRNPNALFTNEDSCLSINNEKYNDAEWIGPIEPPKYP